MNRVELDVDGHHGFVMLPESVQAQSVLDWVWYAPSFHGSAPGPRQDHIVSALLDAGIAVGGIDVGESYGSPEGRRLFSGFHAAVTTSHRLASKPILLAQSRGGLMLYNWASEHPGLVRRIAAIYPVCDMRAWPGLDVACGAYGLTESELSAELERHNPIDRLAPIAAAGIPVFHIHGDSDTLIPLKDHSAELAHRYRELGGDIELLIVEGRGHEEVDEFFTSERLISFMIGPPDKTG